MTFSIYLVNQHYYPELASTGQVFQEIAEHVHKNAYNVTVLAGRPFYHEGRANEVPAEEVINGVKVKRLWNTTFPKSSSVGKLLNLMTFQISLLFFMLFRAEPRSTVIVGTNPPMAIISITNLKWIKNFRILFVVQDLYPDILISSGIMETSDIKYKLLKYSMEKSIQNSDIVIAISDDMKGHIEKNYKARRINVINNWSIGDIFPVNNKLLKRLKGWEDKLVIQYSGNFGIAHEYTTLLNAIKYLKSDDSIVFYIVGGGINYNKLKDICVAEKLNNVIFKGYVPKEDLNANLNTGDISLVIFDDDFKNVLMPSKYYGILACSKPIILISGDENDISRDINEYKVGYHIETGNYQKLVDTIIDLKLNRDKILELNNNAAFLYNTKYLKDRSLTRYIDMVQANE